MKSNGFQAHFAGRNGLIRVHSGIPPRADDYAMAHISLGESAPNLFRAPHRSPWPCLGSFRLAAPWNRGFHPSTPPSIGRTRLVMMQSIHSESLGMRCWKCHAPLKDEVTMDLHSGLSIRQFVCLGCGCRWFSGERPRPAITA